MCRGISIVIFALGLSIGASLPASAQNPVKLKSTPEGMLLVPVFINGLGPYPFVLDTGTNCTLIRHKLLSKLGINESGGASLGVMNGEIGAREVSLGMIGVAGVEVAGVQAIALDGSEIERYAGKADGVLGEDFLRHFDVLLDNRSKKLTLDGEGVLASTLKGEHVPLLLHGAAGRQGTEDRPTIELHLHRGSKNLRFLVDSGANQALLVADDHSSFEDDESIRGSLRTLNGMSRCRFALFRPGVGSFLLPSMKIAACNGTSRQRSDVDGLLPTTLFDRLFLSHLSGYVIFNPQ